MMIDDVQQHTIRIATNADTDTILAFDLIAQDDEKRRVFIRQAIENSHCTVAEIEGQAVAYIIMEHNFFGWPFIELLYVHSDYRRFGLGAALMQYIEANCTDAKLFTSTNLSNLRMQSLLEKLKYTISGVVHVDDGDPEVFYCKRPAKSLEESGYNTAQHSQ